MFNRNAEGGKLIVWQSGGVGGKNAFCFGVQIASNALVSQNLKTDWKANTLLKTTSGTRSVSLSEELKEIEISPGGENIATSWKRTNLVTANHTSQSDLVDSDLHRHAPK